MKNIGLFFGTFNPVHVGHLIIAQTILDGAELNEVWFVVSPQNPFKKSDTLIHARDRLEMVRLAIGAHTKLKPCDIEFNLPQPSYTIDTLTHLADKYRDCHFKLIIGEDNLSHFHKWKNYEQILQYYELLIYPRPASRHSDPDSSGEESLLKHPSIKHFPKPLIEISSTEIRSRVKNKKSIQYFVPDAVAQYIEKYGLYQ